MKNDLVVQTPAKAFPCTIEKTLSKLASHRVWDRLFVGMAYATVSGVRRLVDIVEKHSPDIHCRWVLGLDDYITQPGALDLCKGLPRSRMRVASCAADNARFHPKIILLTSSSASGAASLVIGSSNLTAKGISRNGETIAVISAQSREEAASLQIVANTVWSMGHDPTETQLRTYGRLYWKRRPRVSGRKSQKRPSEVLSSDQAEVDPAVAATCWIEVGKNTALGRELEFKAEQAIYFGLSPHGGDARQKRFLLSNESVVTLRLKYQENAMWRLQMNNRIPEVARGLRPSAGGRLGRSPYAAVFQRTSLAGTFELRFINVNSKSYKTIRRNSLKLGTLGKTSSREYGWY